MSYYLSAMGGEDTAHSKRHSWRPRQLWGDILGCTPANFR